MPQYRCLLAKWIKIELIMLVDILNFSFLYLKWHFDLLTPAPAIDAVRWNASKVLAT